MSSTVLVVGGEGGIGRSICSKLAGDGLRVVSADLAINTYDSERIPLDITNAESIQAAKDHFVSEWGELNALVLASGTFDHFPVSEYQAGRLERLLYVNVLGVAGVINRFLPIMKPGARIVVISSETALAGLPFQPYGMSKRMLECYVDSLRQECSLVGIDVISVQPGAHDTDLLAASKEALLDIPDDSRYRKFLQKVAAEGVRIIDKGGADTQDVGNVVARALRASKPKAYYGVNVSSRFRAMSLLPKRVREILVRKFIMANADA